MVGVAISGGGGPKLEPWEKPPVTFFVKFLAFMAVIGGFLFGYDTGVTSAALLYFPETLGLDYTWQQMVVAVTVGFCGIFSLLAGLLTDIFGRKPVIILASGLFAVGAILLAAAPERWTLLIGRMIIGAAVGLASMTVPTYVAEAAPVHLRGVMVTCFQLMVTLGIFLSSILGGAFSYINPYHVGWRLMFGVAAIPGIVQFVGFFFLPESPRWLATHGKLREAKRVLRKIYGVPVRSRIIQHELKDIRESQERTKKEMDALGGGTVLINMLRIPHVRKALLLGCSLQLFQQLAGVNTLMYYTASIVRMSGVTDPQQAIWMTCMVTGVNFCFTFVPALLVERWGRRKLLLLSQIGVICSLIFLGGGFLAINKTAPTFTGDRAAMGNTAGKYLTDYNGCNYLNCDDCVTMERCGACITSEKYAKKLYGWCLPSPLGEGAYSEFGPCSEQYLNGSTQFTYASNACPTPYPWLPILGMVLYLCCFSVGLAPIPWVMNSEIYPFWARSTGVSIATACNWFANLVISLTFLYLTEAMTKYGAFFLYASITILAWILFFFVVPETKGIELELIEELFGAPPSARHHKDHQTNGKEMEAKEGVEDDEDDFMDAQSKF